MDPANLNDFVLFSGNGLARQLQHTCCISEGFTLVYTVKKIEPLIPGYTRYTKKVL